MDSSQFYKAQALYDDICCSDGNALNPVFQKKVSEALSMFRVIWATVKAESIYSPNEAVDEINTCDLKFGLTLFYLADLCLKQTSLKRRSVVEFGMKQLHQYLDFCDGKGLMGESVRKRYYGKTNTEPAARREAKIAGYKRKKQLQQQHQELARRRKLNIDDEEIERELQMTLYQLYIDSSLDELDLLTEEMQVLDHMDKMQSLNSSKKKDMEDNLGPIPKPKIVRLEPGLQSLSEQIYTRTHAREQVFRDRNPCTMTIEEALAKEIEDGLILQSGSAQPEPEEDDSENEEVSDRKTLKARKWADWTDENPKGSGNKLNR